MKKYLTARDIEDLVARGVTEIPLSEDLVITDLARDRATGLGLDFVRPDGKSPQQAVPSSKPSSIPAIPMAADTVSVTALSPKPKGCLHSHIEGTSFSMPLPRLSSTAASASTSLVDRLVEAVRRLSR